ncbi:MAG TPA: hypothetical protein VFT64_01120 [Rickettsiales bacterium]|nr:hypothetical protein [Rickettsiales bacterium]
MPVAAPPRPSTAAPSGTKAAPAASRTASSAVRSGTEITPTKSSVSAGGIFAGVNKTAGHFTTLMMFAPMLGNLIGWAGRKAPSKMQPHMEKAAGVTGLPGATASEFTEAVGDVFGHSSAVTGATRVASDKISTFAQKTLGSGVQERLSQNSVGNLVTSGTFAALGTGNLVFDSAKKISVLKNMYSDLTGGKKISTLSLMVGHNLPPLMKAARKEAFGGSALFGMGAQLTEIGANLYFLGSKRQLGFGKQMVLSMGLSMVPSMLTSGHTGLAGYDAVQQSGGNASAEAYMNMIGGLAPKNTSAHAVEELARQCISHKASSVEVMHLVNDAFYSGKNPAVGKATAKLTAQNAGIAQAGDIDREWAQANQAGEWAARIQQQQAAPQLSGARGA